MKYFGRTFKAASGFLLVLFVTLFNLNAQNIAISDDDGYSAESSAMLDVSSQNKGLLIPRLTTAQRTTIANPATGLLVFDTDIENFCFYDGSTWKMIEAEYVETDPNAWNKFGNAGTVDGTNFIGTTDDVSLNFRVNNQKAGIITSNGNMFLGYQSGNVHTTGTSNTGIGHRTLFSTAGSHGNTAIGTSALENNTADRNTAVGFGTMQFNTTGQWNTAVGSGALLLNTSGSYNIAIGGVPLQNNLSGSANIAVGGGALLEHQSGNENIAIGMYALKRNLNGISNVAVGIESGYNNVNGSGNVFLGYKAGYNETGSNKLYIANSITNPPLIYGDFSTSKVGIGTINPSMALEVNGSIFSSGSSVTPTSGTGLEMLYHTGIDAAILQAYNYSTSAAKPLQIIADPISLLDGNVGIGTTNPQYDLDIYRDNGWPTTATLRVKGGIGSNGRILLADADVAHGVTDWMLTDVFGNITANSDFGGLAVQGFSESGSESGIQLWGIIGSEDPVDSKAATQISSFKRNGTALQAVASTETVLGIKNGFNTENSLVVLGNGNVGIGTASPGALLHVNTTSSIDDITLAKFFSALDGDGEDNNIFIGKSLGQGQSAVFGYIYNTNINNAGAYITVWGDTPGTTGLFVRKGGNIGVGTESPNSKLTVEGGDINILAIGSGVIMKSPDGSCWRITVDNSGNLISSPISCP